MTVQYAKDRHQFDKPLGAFQAISHYLADAVTCVDGAEVLVREAAWARTVGKPVDRLAPMAKLFACDTFRDVTAMAQQIFGGNGFTLEFDIQMFFRRAKQLQISWWDRAISRNWWQPRCWALPPPSLPTSTETGLSRVRGSGVRIRAHVTLCFLVRVAENATG